MKKVMLFALAGFVFLGIYLFFAPSEVPLREPIIQTDAPKIPDSVKILRQRSASPVVERRVQHSQPNSGVAKSASKKNSPVKLDQPSERRQTEDKATAVVADEPAQEDQVDKKSGGKWIKRLSGEHVHLGIERMDLSGSRDCREVECPERPTSYSVAGVVVEPARIKRKRLNPMAGDVDQGDGQKRPFLYLK